MYIQLYILYSRKLWWEKTLAVAEQSPFNIKAHETSQLFGRKNFGGLAIGLQRIFASFGYSFLNRISKYQNGYPDSFVESCVFQKWRRLEENA